MARQRRRLKRASAVRGCFALERSSEGRQERHMTEASPSPIRDAVGDALRFARANWRFVLIVSAIGAAATTLLTGLSLGSPVVGLPAVVLTTGVQSFIYALLTAAALAGVGAARAEWLHNGLRVWGAMAVIGFFLFIVMFVISIPVMIALFAGPLARYAPELQSAGSDQAAVVAIMTRFAEENPMALLVVMLFYLLIWLYLTSRLYLAAPASVQEKRILTFETWAWTKTATMRIIGARLLLLIAANILAGALGYLFGALVGINAMTPDVTAGAPYLFFTLCATFFRFALYFSLEAGLSAALYRSLRPAETPQPGL
jgi:hypothetical protein